MNKRYLILLAICLVLLSGLACNFSSAAGTQQNTPGAQLETNPSQPEAVQPAPQEPIEVAPGGGLPMPTETAVPTPEPVSTHPLGLRQGLAGLNSYRLRIHMVFNGPSELDRNETTMQIAYNKEGDQFYNRTESTSSSADDPEVSTEVSETYRLEGKSCEIYPDDPESSGASDPASPAEEAMTDAMMYLFDMVVFAENPVLVGVETVNGIPSNHYTFVVSGLNSITGAEVTQSQGEYWIAEEGDYLVKYNATLETRTAPPGDASAEVMYLMVEIDLSDVDTAINITLPAQCQE